MRKTQTIINKPVYLRLSILELGKIAMHKLWYDYEKENCVIWIQPVLLLM